MDPSTLDTTRGLLPHVLNRFEDRPWYGFAMYTGCVASTYLVLLLAALGSGIPISKESPAVSLYFLRDWNIAYTFLVAFPTVFYLLVTDQRMLGRSIKGVMDSGVMPIAGIETKSLLSTWSRVFEVSNRWSQIVALMAGCVLSWFTLQAYSGPDSKIWTITRGNITAGGYAYLYCIALLYALLLLYVSRTVCISLFLRALVGLVPIRMIPSHPDGCGGLRPVGRLGLRNQYTLTVLGVNIAIFVTATFLKPGKPPSPAELHVVLIAVLAYMVLGPLVFLGPLLPFRTGMQRTKDQFLGEVSERLRVEFENLRSILKTRPVEKKELELIERLQKVATTIEALPVWPFDARTLRKFGSVFFVPFVVGFVIKLAEDYISHIVHLG